MTKDAINLEFSSYLDEVAQGIAHASEPCRVINVDGSEIKGVFVSYDAAASCVEVLAEGEIDSRKIPLDRMRMLKLTRTVKPGSVHQHLLARDLAVHTVGKRVPFSITYRDGRSLSGELLGYSFVHGGFGIYLAGEGEEATRCFFPDSAIEDIVIGLPIGQVLLEHGHLTESDLEKALAAQRTLRSQRIGQILAEQRFISREALEEALRKQLGRPHVKIGEVLVEMGAISEEQLHKALEEQKQRHGKPLGGILVDMGFLDNKVVKEALARKLGVPHVDLTRFSIDRNVMNALPASLILKHTVIPLYRTDKSLIVAMANPFDARVITALGFAAQLKIVPVLANVQEIQHALEKHRPDGVVLWQHAHEGEHIKHTR